MKRPFLFLAALVCAALLIAGCTSFDGSSLLGGGGGFTPHLVTPKFLYAGTITSSAVNGFSVDANSGALTPLAGSAFSTAAGSPFFLATNGTDLLFANTFVGSSIESFTIAGDGALSSTGPNTVGGATFVQSVVTPDGKYLLATQLSGSVHVFTISPTGVLTEVAGSPFAGTGMKNSDNLALSPDGKFVFCTNEGVAQINVFSINSTTGALTEIPGSPFTTTGPGFSIAVTADGKFVYSTDENNSELDGFSLNSATGALTPLPGSPFGSGTSDTFVTVDPKAKFVYTTGGAGLFGFTIGTNGALTKITGSPFPTPGASGDYYVIADPSGKFVYVSDDGSSKIYGFSIGSTGALTAVSGSPFTTAAARPGGMVITH